MNDPRPFGAYAPSGFAKWAIERTRTVSNRWGARRLAFLLRRLAVASLKGQPLDVESLGARMRLYPYNNVCESRILFTPQFFDPKELALLGSRIKSGFIFADVGANVGGYALFVAALAGPSGRILAIEPQPEIFDRLTFNIRQNPFGTVKAIACAIADKTGELTMFLDPRNKGESSLMIVGPNEADTIRVPGVTLLDLLTQENFGRPDAVKLDVEGAEDVILDPFFRDAPETLYPSLFIISDGREQWQIDLPGLLESKGYRLVLRTRLNLAYEYGNPREPVDYNPS